MKLKLSLIALSAISMISCKQKQNFTERNDFKTYYDNCNVEGSFVVYDQKMDQYTFYNKSKYTQLLTPASTFKICNSLIGIETGVISDENFVLQWDSVVRKIPNWNMNQNLATAFKNSTVWYYQEIARRVGGKQMKFWLDKLNYGNSDTSGGIDKFWLSGGLKVSAEQQIDFLRRLHDNKLPFSKRTTDIVKKIMISRDTLEYVTRAKTGWGQQDSTNIGWYVGYIETKDNVLYFANCIKTSKPDDNFAKARINITYSILEDLKLIKK